MAVHAGTRYSKIKQQPDSDPPLFRHSLADLRSSEAVTRPPRIADARSNFPPLRAYRRLLVPMPKAAAWPQLRQSSSKYPTPVGSCPGDRVDG